MYSTTRKEWAVSDMGRIYFISDLVLYAESYPPGKSVGLMYKCSTISQIPDPPIIYNSDYTSRTPTIRFQPRMRQLSPSRGDRHPKILR